MVIQAPASPQTAGPASPTQQSSLISNGASQDMFLQLLVAQIQNQDPLNPLDPTQFVSQLSQFSSIEQLLGIRQTLDDINSVLRSQSDAG